MKNILTTIAIAILSQCAQSKHLTIDSDKATSGKPGKVEVDDTINVVDNATYSYKDSVAVENLLRKANAFYQSKSSENNNPQHLSSQTILFIARQLIGTPYVAKTLEKNKSEKLIVNLNELDCTTYVENVLTTYLCVKQNDISFNNYLENLKNVRYTKGIVSYPTRQHYFTEWIEDNTEDGIVTEIQAPNPPFNKKQTINIDFMSTHANLYPMMENRKDYIKQISEMEKRLSGKAYKYISKESIRDNAIFRKTIKDGDIIAITTNKKGLDTSHIGIAVWHKDGLHMLNASQIHKKVVEEPMTLHQYMQKHPSQTGIRIVRIMP